ncbi:Inositol-tetrakisphosphate 1-kinase [Thelohanellus kitauei]|uniref:Inositol-tetrakisphosphate 1-kinase n=1 Tax=Thelohanellus kitauei TaxID=669202 RepID=A0A0C2NF14_THEKT|nr:Inositol-tetrakisphosphate 1-kinase [Thelohanellus kitauei]
MTQKTRVGLLLSPKDLNHLGITSYTLSQDHEHVELIQIDKTKPIFEQGPFSVIVHKISDFVKGYRGGDELSKSIVLQMLGDDRISDLCLDDPMTVLDLANRNLMSLMMERCQFESNGIKVVVPRWVSIESSDDFQRIKDLKISYPLICKVLCAGEGPGSHAMQLIFNEDQLNLLELMPCVAQEFKNHEGEIVKIFVYGKRYFICTRPSVRNFPLNGRPLDRCETVAFDSQQVSKMSAKTFLNNYQSGFVFRSSVHNDHIIDDSVAVELIQKVQSQVKCSFIGIDLFVSDDGKQYNLFDVNFLPSFETIENKFELFLDVIKHHRSDKLFLNNCYTLL